MCLGCVQVVPTGASVPAEYTGSDARVAEVSAPVPPSSDKSFDRIDVTADYIATRGCRKDVLAQDGVSYPIRSQTSTLGARGPARGSIM